MTLTPLAEPVDRAKEAVPTQQAGAAAQARTPQPRPVLGLPQKQLADAQPRREPPHRPVGRENRQRHDDRPRPGAYRVEVGRKPLGRQHDFRRDGRALFVGDLPQQGQIVAGVAVDGVGPAVGQDGGAGPLHVLGAGVVAGEFQGEIGLHAAADIDPATGVHRPTAFGKLLLHQVGGATAGQIGLFMPEKRQQQDRFALQDRVALEFGAPGAVFLLLGQQPLPRAVDGPADRRSERLDRGAFGRCDFGGVVVPFHRQDGHGPARTHKMPLQASVAVFPDAPPPGKSRRACHSLCD